MAHFNHVVGSKTDVFDDLRARLACAAPGCQLGTALPPQFQRARELLAERQSMPQHVSEKP